MRDWRRYYTDVHAERDRLAAELERMTAALREIAHGVHNDATYDVLDCALIARAALAGGGRAAQEDAARGGDAT
jgi:hypothetical protein